MRKVDSLQVLNRLLAITNRSLPMYLTDSRPWMAPGEEQAAVLLADIVSDQQDFVRRIGEMIEARGGVPDVGEFPMEYTDLHDLSIDYLMREAVRYQTLHIGRIERLIALLDRDPEASELARELLGAERAHLEALMQAAK
jgi:hypothetical protein